MLELHLENLDLSFDDQLIKNDKLTWLPWIGVNFRSSLPRTLVLGESTYNWNPTDNVVQERIKTKEHLRVVHQNNGVKYVKSSTYTRNFEKAIFNTHKLNAIKSKQLWHAVAYHNLVLRCMNNLKARPNDNDYELGWKEVFYLFNILNIDQCISYGLEDKKIYALKKAAESMNYKITTKSLPKIGRYRPKTIEITMNERVIKLAFIRHPSSFFSWKKWAIFIREHTSLDFLEPPLPS